MGDLKKLISLSKIQLSTLQSLVKTSSPKPSMLQDIEAKNYAKLTQLMEW